MRWIVPAAVALLLGACDAGLPVEVDAGRAGCADRCPAALECRQGACVGAEAPRWPVALRLRPRGDDALAAVEVPRFEPDGPVTTLPDLPMSTRTTLSGRALLPGPDGPLAIAVRAIARAEQGIAEQPLTATADSVDRADGPRFVLQLAPFWPTAEGGRQRAVYRLTLRPVEAERYPPWVVDDVRVEVEGSQLDVPLPAFDGLPTVEGEVRISQDNPTPIAGLRVFAVDDDNRRISTETHTDAEGRFALRFWPDAAGQATLRVRRAGDVGPLPEIDRPIAVPAAGEAAAFSRIYLGALPSTFALSGRIVDEDEAPVGGVEVRMSGAVGEGVFSVDAGPTDADGAFTVTVYPGRYRVDLEPPPDAGARLARLEAVIEPESAPRWTLVAGPTIRGTVLDPAGDPLPRARLEVRLLSARYADPSLIVPGEAPPARTRQTEADADGRFAIQLDPGEHTVRVVPPADTGLPESDHPLSVPLGGGLPPLEVRIPAAAALVFGLRDGEGQPARDVVVEAWRTDTDPPVRIGEATSDAEGAGVVRLPVTQ